jgi:outer membrane protein assembly factor BamB
MAERIDRVWDDAVRKIASADVGNLPIDQAETIAWFQQLATPVDDPNAARAWGELERRISGAAVAGAPTIGVSSTIPTLPPFRPGPPRRAESRKIHVAAWVSFALVLALLGALINGVFSDHSQKDDLPAIVASPTAAPVPPTLGNDWSQLAGSAARTGATADPGPGGNLHLLWTFAAADDLESIVEANGVVFASGRDNTLYALDGVTGQQVWAISIANGQYGRDVSYPAPAVANDVVLLPSTTDSMFALDRVTGIRQWNNWYLGRDYSTATPTLAGDRVYIAIHDRIDVLDLKTGVLELSLQPPGEIATTAPTIAGDSVVVTLKTGELVSLDAETGDQRWMSDVLPAQGMVAYRDGVLYAPGPNGIVTAVDAASGATIWQADLENEDVNGVAVTDRGVVATVDGSGISLLDRTDGSVIWTYAAPGIVGAALAGGNTVYATTDASTLTAIDLSTGDELGHAPVTLAGSMMAISGGILIVSGQSGVVQAFASADVVPSEHQAQPPHHSILPHPETPLPEQVIAAPTMDDSISPDMNSPVASPVKG